MQEFRSSSFASWMSFVNALQWPAPWNLVFSAGIPPGSPPMMTLSGMEFGTVARHLVTEPLIDSPGTRHVFRIKSHYWGRTLL